MKTQIIKTVVFAAFAFAAVSLVNKPVTVMPTVENEDIALVPGFENADDMIALVPGVENENIARVPEIENTSAGLV